MNSPAQQHPDLRTTLPRMSAPPLSPRNGRKPAAGQLSRPTRTSLVPVDARLAATLDACEA